MILYLQDMAPDELAQVLGEEKAKAFLKNQVRKPKLKPKLSWRQKLKAALVRKRFYD